MPSPSPSPSRPPFTVHPHHHPYPSLLPLLRSHLPHSLPLLRLLTHPLTSTSPTAHIRSTIPPSFPPSPSPSSTATATVPPPEEWAILYVDRARAPETEAWVFCTYEARLNNRARDHRTDPAKIERDDDDDDDDDDGEAAAAAAAAQAKKMLLSLLAACASSASNRLILGSLHAGLLPLLLAAPGHALLTPRAVVSRSAPPQPPSPLRERGNPPAEEPQADAGVLTQTSIEYSSYLLHPLTFPSPSPSPSSSSPSSPSSSQPQQPPKLRPGYAFSAIKHAELALVVARTEIPKAAATLAALRSVGVRKLAWRSGGCGGGGETEGEGELVAWGFLGVDGSLNTLHVEAAERGRGLGKAVGGKLLRMVGPDGVSGGEGNGEERGDGWLGAHVAVGNVASEGVMKSLGGERRWGVYWVEVDLERCRNLDARVMSGCACDVKILCDSA